MFPSSFPEKNEVSSVLPNGQSPPCLNDAVRSFHLGNGDDSAVRDRSRVLPEVLSRAAPPLPGGLRGGRDTEPANFKDLERERWIFN